VQVVIPSLFYKLALEEDFYYPRVGPDVLTAFLHLDLSNTTNFFNIFKFLVVLLRKWKVK
jgi:hypothetical protein